MRRLLTIATLIICVNLASLGAAHARRVNKDECRFQRLDRVKWSRHEIERTIACAVRRWPVPGGLATARCIADRESGDYWHAANPSGASGIFQVIPSTWSSWLRAFRPWARAWNIRPRVWNGRSNVLVSVRAMHQWGLSGWGGSC